MNDFKPEQTNPGEDAELREKQFSADEPGLTTSFSSDGAQVITKDGPQSPHIQSQNEFWEGVENADQTPAQVENQAAPLNPNEFPGETSNRSDATGDTESSVLI
ncbi:hypothetical protein IAD21_00957 [Abditibacteriota bacterium]|nr:hypothetical protein IAD21_00957 [Abditibacteriota bacterium]